MTLQREDLVDGIEHVLHEIRLLVGALSLSRQRRMRLSLPPDALSPDLLSLAVRATPIELPALHASHLLGFFAEPQPNDELLRAAHYLDGYQVDDELRPRLASLRERVDAQVAPLTKRRISNEGQSTGPHSYSFRPGEFLPLLECCRRFTLGLLESSWLDTVPPMARNDWRDAGVALETLISDIG